MHIIPVRSTYRYLRKHTSHPICSPFLHFRQLYKSPLDLDSADCSIACGRAPSGKEAAERDGGEGKDKIFGIKNRLKNIIENMSGIMIGAIIETIAINEQI